MSKNNLFFGLRYATTIHDLIKHAEIAWKVENIDLSGLNFKAVEQTFLQMDKAIEDFPFLKGYISEISKGSIGIMSHRVTGRLDSSVIKFHDEYYRQLIQIKTAYEHEIDLGNAPAGSKYQHAGVHEIGHAVVAYVTKLKALDLSVTDFGQEKMAVKITDEALYNVTIPVNEFRTMKKYEDVFDNVSDTEVVDYLHSIGYDEYKIDKIQTISVYAARNGAEAVAEAFTDWYANGDNAKTLSKSIMQIVKKYCKEEKLMINNTQLVDTSTAEKARKTTPRFYLEGWALYEGGDYTVGILKGREIRVKKTGFNFIGVKPDAPEWAKQEYEEWTSY